MFGAQRLPQLARSLGQSKGEFEKGKTDSKPEDSLEVKESDTETKEELPEVDPVVDLVGKAISTHNPNRGAFFQGVQKQGTTNW